MPRKTAEDVLVEAFELTDAIKPFITQTAQAIQQLHESGQATPEARAALEAQFLEDVRAATGANEQDIMAAVRIRSAGEDAHIAAEVHAQIG